MVVSFSQVSVRIRLVVLGTCTCARVVLEYNFEVLVLVVLYSYLRLGYSYLYLYLRPEYLLPYYALCTKDRRISDPAIRIRPVFHYTVKSGSGLIARAGTPDQIFANYSTPSSTQCDVTARKSADETFDRSL